MGNTDIYNKMKIHLKCQQQLENGRTHYNHFNYFITLETSVISKVNIFLFLSLMYMCKNVYHNIY